MLDVAIEIHRRDLKIEAAFSVHEGERMALFGPSGSGKTSILEVIAGLLRPTAGRVSLRGRDLTRAESDVNIGVPPWTRRVGLLRQNPGLFPHLTVRQNITYSNTAASVPEATLLHMAGRLEIAHLLKFRPRALSGGQAHRVALARLLLADHDALLLDEPYTGLDARLRRVLTEVVREESHSRSVPSVLVAHELPEAQAFADRLAILDAGHVLQIGSPADVVRRPATRRVAELVGYLGFVPALVVVDQTSEARPEPSEARPAPSGVVMGVHPERTQPGASPGLGVVLRGLVTGVRPAGTGWEIDLSLERGEPGPNLTCWGRGRPALISIPVRGHGAGSTVVRLGRKLRHGSAASAVMTDTDAPAETTEPPPRRSTTDPPGRVPDGDRLRLARLAARLSQQELASAAGVSRQAVAGLEAGRWNPSLHVALDLARALGITVEELFGPGEPPPPIDVSLLADAPPVTRVDLAVVGSRTVALPLIGATTMRAGFLRAAGSLEDETGRPRARPFGALRPTLVVAGCDPALALLEAPLGKLDPPIALAWWPCSTTEAVQLAASGLVHVAAAHLPVVPLAPAPGAPKPRPPDAPDRGGHRNAPTAGAAIGFTTWREGLVLHPARAQGVHGLSDVAGRNLRLVNREIGAEARSLLESLRLEEGVSVERLGGYESEVRGHLEVAAAIGSGLADVGPASEPAGLAYGLSFVPVATERCELRIREPMLETREVQALLRVLASPALRIQIDSLPGYDAAICGELIWSA